MKANNSSDCESCKFAQIDESNKARVKIVCTLKNKTYYYGQHIECDCHEKKE